MKQPWQGIVAHVDMVKIDQADNRGLRRAWSGGVQPHGYAKKDPWIPKRKQEPSGALTVL